MDSFFYWSGVFAWATLGMAGAIAIGDSVVEFVLGRIWTQKQFIAFVADRLRQRRS